MGFKYSSTDKLWPEKNLDEEKEKKINLKEEIETIHFNEEEFTKLVLPIINKLILKNNTVNNDTQTNLYFEKIKKEQELIHESIKNSKFQLPSWTLILISILSTSIFFLFIILIITIQKK